MITANYSKEKDGKKTFKFKDLCESFEKKYKSPLPYTDLGKYIVHYKSKGKENFIKNKKI